MTDPIQKTLPQDVIERALAAIAKICAWNSAVLSCRAIEALAGRPGRYEYELITDHHTLETSLTVQEYHGSHALDLLEESARAQGWTVDELYAAIGQPWPAVLDRGPDVWRWRKAQR